MLCPVPTLRALLDSPDQSVRLKAALAAGTYPDPEYIEILIAQCTHEPDFFVRDTLSWALMRHDVTKVVKRLETELQSSNPQAKSQAIHTLSKIGDKANYLLITDEMLFDQDDFIASTAWRVASVLVPDDQKSILVKKLITQLGRGDSDTQFGLTRFLCALGECIVEPLTEASNSTDETISNQAKFTLLRFREMQLESTKTSSK
ncbi:MAG: HEAT repeat domain-containing protein [Actinobacteria bacterium]|nr:HEAT repeat domain-containing protein [Actinomycetota bacterium]